MNSATPKSFSKALAQKEVLAALTVLLLSLALTHWSWNEAKQDEIANSQQIFEIRADEVKNAIELRMDAYTQVMRGGAGLFDASVSVERGEWRTYIQKLDLHKNYPGLQALGYHQIVSGQDRMAHESSIRAEGFPDYAIHPEGKRHEYAPLVFTEPFSGMNLKAFGYDAYAESNRRAALEIARDTGEVTASAKIPLILDGNNQQQQPGFIMVLPVYRHGQPATSIEQRRAALSGYIVAVFRTYDLMEGILGDSQSVVDLHIFDGSKISLETQLYDSDRAHQQTLSNGHRGIFLAHRNVSIGGRVWSLQLSSLPSFDAALDHQRPWTLLIFGVLVSLLLALLTWALIATRKMADARAKSMKKMKQAMQALKENESLLNNIVENIPISIFIKNPRDKFRIIHWNKASETIFSLPRERVIGKTAYENWPREQAELCQTLDEQVMRDGKIMEIPVEASTSGDATIYLHTRKLPLFDAAGNPSHLLVICDDITERKRTEDQLRLAAQVFENSGEGIMITDQDKRIISVNRAFTAITGYPAQEVIGANPRILGSGQQSKAFYQQMWATLLESGQWSGEIYDRRKNGEIYPEWLHISAIRNDAGEVVNYIGSFSDITERKAAEAHIRFLAEHDGLTRLPNRMLFQDRLKQAIAHAARKQERLALMFLDLDHFKDINDTLGHTIGDKLLLAVAERLTENVREGDTVSRQGGDEFIILLPGIENPGDATLVAEKLLETVRQPYHFDSQVLNISFSIGISLYPDDSRDMDELRRKADAAMYQAKQGGRNTYRFFTRK